MVRLLPSSSPTSNARWLATARPAKPNGHHTALLGLLAVASSACTSEVPKGETATTTPAPPSTTTVPSASDTQTTSVAPPATPPAPTPPAPPPGATGPTGPTGDTGATSTPTSPTQTSTQSDTTPMTAPSGSDPSGDSGSDVDSATGSSQPPDTTEQPSTCEPNGRAHNPLVTHIFTADPNATVYGDRVYLYVSHDVDGQDDYDMVDYRGFSSDDMVNWQDHGVLIHAESLPWATNLYAPGACTKNGKYYLYMPNGGSSIGVAVSDDPGGPFVDPLGDALLTKDYPNSNVPWLFDPACFVDDDGQGYLYFGGGNDGGQNARVIRLNDDMVSLKDASATTVPTTAFFEASFMHKHEGTYYFSYSSDFSTDHGAALEYLTSDNPMTGFTYKGKFLPNSNINEGNNNHGSIIEFQGKTYVFYHARKLEQELGVNKVNNRSVALQEITYGANNALNQITMSTEDFTVSQLKCLNGFAEVQAETLAGERGIEVEGKAGETVYVGQISNDDWVGYSQVDFRNGASKLVLKVASAQGAGNIDVRIDNCLTGEEGSAIGTCTIASTGSATTFETLTCVIAGPAGPHDLCLHFNDNPSFVIDSWHLE